MAAITFSNVVKRYEGGEPVVKGVDLEVASGEFLVLLGSSGCGKTTLLRMVAGLESITSGQIEIGDRVINDVPPRDRDVAMVFQNYALYPHMRVDSILRLSLKLRRAPKDEIDRRVAEAVDLLGIRPLLDRYPAQLSGGQQQRVALGRAIVRTPDCFLLDEPLSNLDARLRTEMRTQLVQLHRRLGKTMIYVTHDQSEALTMATRIAVMRDGKVEQIGPPQDIYEKPVSRYVAGFLGSVELNTVKGRLSEERGRLRFDGGLVAFDIEGSLASRAATWKTRDIEVGIRPESLHVVPPDDPAALLTARADVVEPLGATAMVVLDAGPRTLTAEVPWRRAPRVGERVGLTIEGASLLAFDPATGRAI